MVLGIKFQTMGPLYLTLFEVITLNSILLNESVMVHDGYFKCLY